MSEESIRILYVDDYPLDRALVRDALMASPQKFELIEAVSRQQFAALLKEQRYDLVLSDFNILGFTGLEVLDEVKRLLPGVPVLIVTGTGSEEIAAEAIKRGAADYVIKSPGHIRRLPHIILTALDNQRLRNESLRTQMALNESEERYRKMVDQAGAALFLHDLDGRIVDVNQVTVERYGYSRDELLELYIHEIDPDVIQRGDSYRIWPHLYDRDPVQFETWHLKKGGLQFPADVSLSAIELQDQQFIMELTQDITERKNAELALIHSQRLLLALSKAAQAVQRVQTPEMVYQTIGEEIKKLGFHTAIMTISKNGEYIEIAYVSFEPDVFIRKERSTGISSRHVRFRIAPGGFFEHIIDNRLPYFSNADHRPVAEMLPEMDEPIVNQLVGMLNLDQAIYAPLVVSEKVHGFLVVIDSSLSPDDITAVGAFANQAGIALQNAYAVQSLRENQRTLSTLMGNLPGMAYRSLNTRDWTMLFVSEGCYELTGYSPGELNADGKVPFGKIIHPEDRAWVWQEVQEAIKLGQHFELTYRIQRADGQERWVWERGRCTQSGSDSPEILEGFVTDITDRINAEDELRQRSEELKLLSAQLAETEEAERRRLARELHDLVGQSLAVLGLNLNMVKEQLSAQGQKDLIVHLDHSVDAVSEISQQIRGVMDELRPSILDDYGLLAALHWFTDRFSERTGIKTTVIGESIEPRISQNVESAFFRITQEALTNVARHAGASQVTISLQRENQGVCLKIVDDGRGFDLTTEKKPGQRRGWGLFNMRERAELVGASFQLETTPGVGSEIRLQFPGEIHDDSSDSGR